MNSEHSISDNQNLNTMTEEELKNMRRFLFQERISLLNEKKALEEMYEKFMQEKQAFSIDMKVLEKKISMESKRLKDEQTFFDKKFDILKNGFASLEMDRKAFEREKNAYLSGRNNTPLNNQNISYMFSGVTSYLGLRKRYKDLMKIFHPDNLDGDERMVIAIKEEFEKLKERF